MAGSVNKVILVGNLGRDPEVRHTQDGSKIVHLAIATSERWRDRNSGENRERTEWHRVVIFNERLGEVAEKYLSKGRSVYLEGQLQTRKWQDQSGQERYTTEVVLQRFRGELVLLGGRDEGPSLPDEREGGDWGRSASEPARGGGGGRRQGGARGLRRPGRRDSVLAPGAAGRCASELDIVVTRPAAENPVVARFRERVLAALGDSVERIVLFGSRPRRRACRERLRGCYVLGSRSERVRAA